MPVITYPRVKWPKATMKTSMFCRIVSVWQIVFHSMISLQLGQKNIGRIILIMAHSIATELPSVSQGMKVANGEKGGAWTTCLPLGVKMMKRRVEVAGV